MDKKILYDPNHEVVYSYFSSYFENPKMVKIKSNNEYSIYVRKIYAVLGNEFRYIIAILYEDNLEIGNEEKLSNLKWISLQTRSIEENYNTEPFYYTPKKDLISDENIFLIKKDEKTFKYNSKSLPILITLLVVRNNDYSEKGIIPNALETYQTIITFTN
jgi:hypothetical protein